MRILTLALGAYYFFVGLIIFFKPEQFYINTPGLAQMGPYNFHFIIDISLTFIASSLAILWGAYYRVKSTAIAGAAWPFLHALFHLQIWVHRSLAIDVITLADFLAVIIPGGFVLYLSSQINGENHA